MGFRKIFWGFLFLFDLRIQGFDILPDIIGYWLIYLGLKELGSMSLYFAEAKKYSVILGFLAVFDIYEVQIPMEQFTIDPLTGSIVLIGIIIIILDLIMVFNLCHGIAELAKSRGEKDLEIVALNRWKYYLYLKVASAVLVPMTLIVPPLVIVLLIPLIVISLIVFVLMMGLMKQAEYRLS